MKPLFLASASPRRRELLKAVGIDIRVHPSDAEETAEGAPHDLVMENARRKCTVVVQDLSEHAVVIAADTIVVHDDDILGKPVSLDEARAFLKRLSGNTHSVYTGVAVVDTETGISAEGFEETRVTFRRLSDSEIELFVDTVKPLDRAGAYTVDGPGTLLVERYDGCYTNVLGLPLIRVDNLLREIGDGLYPRVRPDSARFL